MKQSGNKKKSGAKGKLVKPSYAANIKVVGVGGGGCSAVSRMRDTLDLKGVDFIAINTDAQDLDYCNAKRRIYIGKNLTKGLGTGMNPELGRQSAEETRAEIVEALKGADLVFITTGLGGGTGSGASPVVAEAAREAGALTVAVITKPFAFEGVQRARIATDALAKLKEKVDTYIVIPNDRIFSIISKDTPIVKAFEVIDNVLKSAISSIAELIAMHGLVNVDFADVKATMQNTGGAVVTVGYASGQERAVNAVNDAINSPLLETSIEGARSVLLGISGGRDLKMNEINDIAKVIGGAIDQNARITFGAYHDKKLKAGQVKVTLIATNFNGAGVTKGIDAPSPSLFASTVPETKIDRAATPQAALASAQLSDRDAKDDGKKDADKSGAAVKKKTSEIWDIPTFLRRNRRGDA